MCTGRGEFKGSFGVALIYTRSISWPYCLKTSRPMVVAEKTVDGMIGFLSVK